MDLLTDHLHTPLGTTSNYSAMLFPHFPNHYMLSLLQPAVSSLKVSWQQILASRAHTVAG
jgi:hypothetical protein